MYVLEMMSSSPILEFQSSLARKSKKLVYNAHCREFIKHDPSHNFSLRCIQHHSCILILTYHIDARTFTVCMSYQRSNITLRGFAP